MVVETEHGHYGFVVDEVLGDHQTVIKNLGRLYRNVQVVSGATILGNGTVALILDPHRLVQHAVRAAPESRPSQGRRPARAPRPGRPDSTSESHTQERKYQAMLRKVNGNRNQFQLRNGGSAVLNYGRAWRAPPGRRRDVGDAAGSQEILRLVEASRQGRLGGARQAGPVSGSASRDRAGHQRHAGRDSAAHRGRQPHPGPDLRRQDRRTDRPDLQGRPRKDETGRQQRGHGACRACRRNWRG